MSTTGVKQMQSAQGICNVTLNWMLDAVLSPWNRADVKHILNLAYNILQFSPCEVTLQESRPLRQIAAIRRRQIVDDQHVCTKLNERVC
jgi:hypothetical protein